MNEEQAIEIVRNDGLLLRDMSAELKNNKKVVLAALLQNNLAYIMLLMN
jgi:hypothetical protein